MIKLIVTATFAIAFALMNVTEVNSVLLYDVAEAPSNSPVVGHVRAAINTAAASISNARTSICSKHISPRLASDSSTMAVLIYDRLSLCPKPKTKFQIIKEYATRAFNVVVVKTGQAWYGTTMSTGTTYYNSTKTATMKVASDSYSFILSSYNACITSIKTGMSTLQDGIATSLEKSGGLTAEDFDTDDDIIKSTKNEEQATTTTTTTEPLDSSTWWKTVVTSMIAIVGYFVALFYYGSKLMYQEYGIVFDAQDPNFDHEDYARRMMGEVRNKFDVDRVTAGFIGCVVFMGALDLGMIGMSAATCFKFVALAMGLLVLAAFKAYHDASPREQIKMLQSLESFLKPVTTRYMILGWKVWLWGSSTAIKKEFRRMSLKYHPDKFKPTAEMEMTKEQAMDHFKAITEAYGYLTGRN